MKTFVPGLMPVRRFVDRSSSLKLVHTRTGSWQGDGEEGRLEQVKRLVDGRDMNRAYKGSTDSFGMEMEALW